MEMNRIDALVADRNIWYDDEAVEGWIRYCEAELTLTDGEPLVLLDSFKLWGEQVFGWYYYTTRSVYVKDRRRTGWALRAAPRPQASDRQAVPHRRAWRREEHVRVCDPELLPEHRHVHDASDHDRPDDEARRGGHVPDRHGDHSRSRPPVQVPHRRFDHGDLGKAR